ncbi:hypothetical protein BG74_02060 [Sodalis-like endosymbiont of Proechinophthirus fluctus]|uniref:hypothetical protein n=1 Tax=Sodalis-like endosymbiont of Proechinophthirus fluctus TaxID=1462730 RepID=UPI0007A8D08F|nr:hypothetical protein [Sodalis-like endosymbiont of Proechinophthirus fluctus]KYP97560.1 hypothetical protein BG74_02060 [Sodalis-like endosymbiont of Proechinophthirus fluctus]
MLKLSLDEINLLEMKVSTPNHDLNGKNDKLNGTFLTRRGPTFLLLLTRFVIFIPPNRRGWQIGRAVSGISNGLMRVRE